MFPLLYHAHHQLHPEDLAYWLDLAQQYGAPVLELGCGSGRVLLPLARAGWRAYGLDLHPGMLRWLQQQVRAEASLPLQVWQADMTRFSVQPVFNLVVCPCNTFSTLDAPARLALLDCVSRSLAPAGRFVFSVPNPSLLRQLPARSAAQIEDVFLHPLDGEPVQVSSSWKRNRKTFQLTWHYDHLLPDGRVDRVSVQVSHWLASVEIYLDELRQTGLVCTARYGDFDRSAWSDDAPNLILEAQLATD